MLWICIQEGTLPAPGMENSRGAIHPKLSQRHATFSVAFSTL